MRMGSQNLWFLLLRQNESWIRRAGQIECEIDAHEAAIWAKVEDGILFGSGFERAGKAS